MTDPLLSQVETRILAILCGGYGNGTYTHAIPSGRYRHVLGTYGLRDQELEHKAFDRAIELFWKRGKKQPTAAIVGDATSVIDYELELRVGYLYGLADLVLHPGESASNRASARAMSDADRHEMALGTLEMLDGTDPIILGITRDLDPGTECEELNFDGRIIATTRYQVTVERDNTKVYG